jgi:alpha-L-fucosidase
MSRDGGALERRRFLQLGAGALLAGGFGLQLPDARHINRFLPGTQSPDPDPRLAWWREARFGLFLHWGLYSILAGERNGRTDYGEWIRNNARIPDDEYLKLMDRFDPVAFDPDVWVSLAKSAGMRYVVITTKHHDGFSLFDSALTDYDVMSTPFRRDIMRAMADACRRHGLRICWYHSIMDWHHPDYLPRRSWENRPVDGASFDRYVRFLHGQVEELLTRYGDIGVMWFDGQWESTWTRELGEALYERCRALQPAIIVNNRVGEGLGDFGTPEQEIPATGLPGVDWESCITMNRNWGYNRADHDFKTLPTLVEMLVDTASRGGNLLLNVGPTAEGLFPAESVERLQGLGRWMRLNGDAIHGTTASPFADAPFRATSGPNRLNLFLTGWAASPLLVPGLRTPVKRAYLPADPGHHPLPTVRTDEGVLVSLPVHAPDPLCSVLVLEFDGPPQVRA